MTKLIETWFRPGKFMMLLIVINLIFLAFGWRSGLDRNTWPSWIQGVGSVEAILVAIWVTWHQTESQRLAGIIRAQEDSRGVLSCLKSEVIAMKEHVNSGIGPFMQAHPDSQPFRFIFPLDADPFPVYRGLIPQFGGIEPVLRNEIVQTYGKAQSFVSTFRYHNMLVEKLVSAEDAYALHSTPSARDTVTALENHLAEYSSALMESFKETMKRADNLIQVLG